MFSSVLSAATIALASFGAASASPIFARQSGCAAGNENASSFQLFAYNIQTTNANDTGAPLVVGFKAWTGSASGSYYTTIMTEDSYRTSNQSTTSLSLVDGALLPNMSGASSAAMTVSDGAYLQFEISQNAGELPSSATSYCFVNGETSYSLLAMNGDTDNFSLCKSFTPYSWGTPVALVYKATDDSSENNHIYDYSTCYPVRVQMS